MPLQLIIIVTTVLASAARILKYNSDYLLRLLMGQDVICATQPPHEIKNVILSSSPMLQLRPGVHVHIPKK